MRFVINILRKMCTRDYNNVGGFILNLIVQSNKRRMFKISEEVQSTSELSASGRKLSSHSDLLSCMT